MFIVVSNNDKMPPDLVGTQIEHWSRDEFIIKGSADEGIDIDEGIYFDVACLDQELYENLLEYASYGVLIVYYRFEDTPDVSFKMMDEVKVYAIDKPKPEPVYEEPVQEEFDEPEPEYEEPVQPQPRYQEPPQPQYNQPQQQFTPQYNQPPQYQQNPVQSQYVQPMEQKQHQNIMVAENVTLVSANTNNDMSKDIRRQNISNILQNDPEEHSSRTKNRKAAKVILFGSSKGGTGKTFTCLATAYWYAKTHPTEDVALADFDIIDGQIGITVNKITPTMQNYYNLYMQDQRDIDQLRNCKVKSEYFSPNLDFYLAPSQDIPQITNDTDYWTSVFKLLITNYDVVFFDSGIDYLGKAPISQLYKIADKIIITCNPSINSVKSVIKQFKTLSGERTNPVFRAADDIMSRVNVVLTRVYENQDINEIVVTNLVRHAPVIAAFGNIDNIISRIQWYQEWTLIDTNPEITESLTEIASLN